jgi:pyrroline-5-carboxylate reductase
MNHQIGFIGGGNMAQAIIAGLLKSGRSSSDIIVSDPNPECRKALSTMGITSFQDSTPVMAQAGCIVLAVKPQIMDYVLTRLADSLQETHIIISIAAGITIRGIRRQLNDARNPVVRVMPNTPALIGEGMSALTSDSELDDDIKTAVQTIFDACGQALWVPNEEAIDAVTAVSGSGPAYFFLMIENLINTGIRLGLSPDVARALVIQTAKGAAGMVELSDVGPDILRQRVTSPGGTTEAALNVFNEGDFSDLVDRALIAARDRAGELSKDAP